MWYDPGIFLTQSKQKKIRNLDNQMTAQNVFVQLAELPLSCVEIKGLPDTISERVVKQSLLWYGSVVFFIKDGALFALPGVPTGSGFNIYGDPGSAWVFSRYNGRMYDDVKLYIPGSDKATFLKRLIGSTQIGTPTGVIVWDNTMRYPFINQTFMYSKAIADCYRTLDITRYWLKRPLLLTGPEEYSESVANLINGMGDNPNAIYIKEMVGVQKQTTLLNTNANGQNLQDVTGLLGWYESQYRSLCGVDSNSQMDKKGENLITAEITVNNQYQSLQLDNRIKETQHWLDIVYEFFGDYFTEKPEIVKSSALEEVRYDDSNVSDMGAGQPQPDTTAE